MAQINYALDGTDNLLMPLPPEKTAAEDMDIYVRFMRHMRCIPTSRRILRILSAIQFTADMLDCSDAHVGKVLVNLGLRAPRKAFPASFLSYADTALKHSGWDVAGPNAALEELRLFWSRYQDDDHDDLSCSHEGATNVQGGASGSTGYPLLDLMMSA